MIDVKQQIRKALPEQYLQWEQTGTAAKGVHELHRKAEEAYPVEPCPPTCCS